MKWNKYSIQLDQRVTHRHVYSAEQISVQSPKRVLDVGCGFGATLSLLDPLIFKVGIEQSISAAKIASHNSKAAFIVASATGLPFLAGSFSVVGLFEVLEHIKPKYHSVTLLEIWKVLEKDGILCMSVPHQHPVSNILDPAWLFGHTHFSPKEIALKLAESGFRVTKMVTRAGIWEQLAMINLYICKWCFNRDMIFREFFESMRVREYRQDYYGFVTLFVTAKST